MLIVLFLVEQNVSSYTCIKVFIVCLFVSFDSVRSSQQFFSYVGTGLPGLNQVATSKGLGEDTITRNVTDRRT